MIIPQEISIMAVRECVIVSETVEVESVVGYTGNDEQNVDECITSDGDYAADERNIAPLIGVVGCFYGCFSLPNAPK